MHALSAGPCITEDNFESRIKRGMTSWKEYAWSNATVPYLTSEEFSKYSILDSDQHIFVDLTFAHLTANRLPLTI